MIKQNDKNVPLTELTNAILKRKITNAELNAVKWWVTTILQLPKGTEKNKVMMRTIVNAGGITNIVAEFNQYAGNKEWEIYARDLVNRLH